MVSMMSEIDIKIEGWKVPKVKKDKEKKGK